MRTSDADFTQHVLESDMPVLVDFWASWCPPCKMAEPMLDKLAREYEGKVKIIKLNVDQNPNVAARYEVKGVPTFILFKASEIVDRKVAAQTENQIRKMLESALLSSPLEVNTTQMNAD